MGRGLSFALYFYFNASHVFFKDAISFQPRTSFSVHSSASYSTNNDGDFIATCDVL